MRLTNTLENEFFIPEIATELTIPPNSLLISAQILVPLTSLKVKTCQNILSPFACSSQKASRGFQLLAIPFGKCLRSRKLWCLVCGQVKGNICCLVKNALSAEMTFLSRALRHVLNLFIDLSTHGKLIQGRVFDACSYIAPWLDICHAHHKL